ncbi:MAG: ribonuclease P protein component [Deltaproteobacteria bacterium]|nr:ribonuclease P protein component [Deltaproteobacteria bacterium]
MPAAGRKRQRPLAEPEGQRLPSTHRLRKRVTITRVQDAGRRFVSGSIVMLVLPNTLGGRRMAVTVSTKVGNSVVRSKVKRWLRQVFRTRRDELPASVDVVLVARASAAQSSLARLTADFQQVASQARRASPPGAGR